MNSKSPSLSSSLSALPRSAPSLASAFGDFALEAPEEVALRCAWDRGEQAVLNRGELAALVLAYCGGLRENGVCAGDRVMLALGTSIEFVATFWATLLLGAVAVPVPPLDARGKQDGRLQQLARVSEVCSPVLAIIGAEAANIALPCRAISAEHLAGPELAPGALAGPRPDDIAVLQFTSGSTGRPRGCALSHRAMLRNAQANVDRLAIKRGDNLVSWLPLFHDMGLMTGILAPIVARVPVRLRSPARFLVNPVSWLEDLAEGGNSHTAVPNFALALTLQRIERRAPQTLRLDSVKSVACGAEPIDPDLVRRFLVALAPYGLKAGAFHAAYGMAEATLMVSSRPGGLATTRLAGGEMVNLGRPVPEAEIRIQDERGQLAPPGEIGEVQVRSPSLMDGYHGDPVATHAKLVDGWLNTGDLGCLIGDELYVAGRMDDLIIVAGRNVYPSDVEYAIARALGVSPSRIAAFGARSALGTDAINVVVETKLAESDAGLISSVGAACLAACGVAPGSIRIVRSGGIPRTTSGKIRRSELRRQMILEAMPAS